MQTNITPHNSIFTYAFTGALLFIAALGAFVSGRLNVPDQLPYTIIAFVLGGSSAILLYKAVKYDKDRLKEVR